MSATAIPLTPVLIDPRPLGSPEEDVDVALAAGVRLMIDPDGTIQLCDRITSVRTDAEYVDAERRVRALQRVRACIRQCGWSNQLAEVIRARGVKHAGSGWIVLEASPETEI